MHPKEISRPLIATGSSMAPVKRLPLWRVSLHDAASIRRTEIEEWIIQRFRETHHATVRTFLPYLLVIENVDATISAVAGFGSALGRPLFLEQYLDGLTIEDQLTLSTVASHGCIAKTVLPTVEPAVEPIFERGRIVEIGNLAASATVSLPLLFLSLDSLLKGLGFEWAVFTATRTVRALLRRARFPFIELTTADGACLGSDRSAWGSYYAADPRVAAIHHEAQAPALPRRYEELVAACHQLGIRGVERAA